MALSLRSSVSRGTSPTGGFIMLGPFPKLLADKWKVRTTSLSSCRLVSDQHGPAGSLVQWISAPRQMNVSLVSGT